MAEPENHTLRLLREFREEFREFRKESKDFRSEFNAFRAETGERFNELTRLFAGETVLGRYAAADVEKRLTALETRMAAVEKAG
jgi:uncharacterized NAD(P)/FAD-binding protein YdhS